MSLGRLHQLHQLGEDMGGLPSSAMVWPSNDGDHWRPLGTELAELGATAAEQVTGEQAATDEEAAG